MKAFQFRLEALLDVLKRKEEEIELRLAQKNRQAEEVRRTISLVHGKLKDLQSSEKEKRKSGEDVVSMRCSVAYRHSLKLDLLREGRMLDDIVAQAHGIHQELVKASQERRAVEIIKEKRYEEWKRKCGIAEQGFINEVSQNCFLRSRTRSK